MIRRVLPPDDPAYEAPWTEAALLRRRDALRAIDVCGAMDECEARTCPCALLNPPACLSPAP